MRGNWIEMIDGKPDQVVDVMCDSVNTINGGGILDDISGIPLTTEILEKAGFEVTGRDKSIYTLFLSKLDESEFSRQRIDFFVDNSHGKVELCRSGVCFKMVPCQYLHQLQNLIHTLTGEELKITLLK